jgi:hypothetical protein
MENRIARQQAGSTESDFRSRIFRIRGQQVMLDIDLACYYGTSVGRFNEAVRRNITRFPIDFMFQLSEWEWSNLKSQNAISSSAWGGRRSRPLAFTEHGIAMLASVLHSPEAIRVNIAIVRAFIKLRHAVLAHQDLGRRIEKVEGRFHIAETDIRLVQEDVGRLKKKPSAPEHIIHGFEP